MPPRLLAVACSGALLGATMDATAAGDVWKEATRKLREKKIDGLPWEGCLFFLKEILVIPLISESLAW